MWSVAAAFAATVPLVEAPTGHLLVEVEVGGVARRFLVDSGAGVVAVTPALARALSLEPGREVQANAVDGTVSVVLTELSGLTVAGVPFPPLEAAIIDLSRPMEYIGAFDGVLGRGFFEAADVLLDLQRDTMEVLPAGTLRRSLRDSASVRFRLHGGNPVFAVTIAGSRGRTVLDTGANGSLLPTAWAEHAGLPIQLLDAGISGAAGTFVPVGTAHADDVVVGGVSLGPVSFGTRSQDLTATLGLDALGTRQVGLSYRDRRVFLP
jgi:predicted aspartyl protease